MTTQDWKRLADKVIARRVELGMHTTTALAERSKLTPRALGDVENARRTNYTRGTKAQIEHALDWVYGSIDDILAGKDPTVVDGVTVTSSESPPLPTADEDVERLIIAQGWATAVRLTDAITELEEPNEELLAAAREAVSFIAAYLIIRILRTGSPEALEDWLARIYIERDELFRRLWPYAGAPAYPWLPRTTSPAASEVDDGGVAEFAFTDDSEQNVTNPSGFSDVPTVRRRGGKR